MIYYLIGGLGADERVFKKMNINAPNKCIKWIDPLSKESLCSYVNRLSSQIDASILISSVVTSEQLPRMHIAVGRLGVLNLIPNILIKPPQFIMNIMFGALDKTLLKEIIIDTDPNFIKWALKTIIKWRSDFKPLNCIRIHGTSDRLIPLKDEAIKINNGQHFMIVDRAEEISEIINTLIDNNS